jgi:hypothetical protein
MAADSPSATLSVSGGITLNGEMKPLLFTWNAPVPITGSGWTAGEGVAIALYGPLNSPGVPPAEVRLGSVTADALGNLAGAPVIPYDGGITGAAARIPRPGLYAVRATGPASGMISAADAISLCPGTYTADQPLDWTHERGARDGVLPGDFKQFSPERFDPEWATVWDERPVEAYGTIAPTGDDPVEQPSKISPSDNPATHYGHDAISFMVPDPTYQWVIGTSNYYAGEPDSPELGRMEIEWETLNGGSTATYGKGNIGLPLWATPTAGDRVYVVGRWILDAGHPELGGRTEMHPPRLMATMRRRPAGTAAQVDIYVSGHGAGANYMPVGLSTTLNQGGYGGGRIRDVLNASEQERYYRAGPLSPLLSLLVIPLIERLAGASLTAQIFPDAGPTAFPWGDPSPEEHAINDMDYDFEVPLPPPPDGATAVVMNAITQPQHGTSVLETVMYTNLVNGLPTTAHIHLPYKDADNGIYARTLQFSWDVPPPVPSHLQVSINRLNVLAADGKWQLWADVSGQWSYLSGLAAGLLQTRRGESVTLPPNQTDVWLRPDDTLRVYVQGYRAACVDGYFGQLFGKTSYNAGITFLADCGPIDNDSLGGALLEMEQPVTTGNYNLRATAPDGGSPFSVDVTVTAAP